MASDARKQATTVVVASTVMLSFISFWRAAAIVLSDLASSVYYAGGIAEQAIGRAAPWFILGVMLFSFAVRAVYLESCSMFVRGGVYIVVRDAMGPFLARMSVSALIFDYILTGPISAVAAGQYLAGLFNEVAKAMHSNLRVPTDTFSAGFAILATVFFWRANIRGIHESSTSALRIMQITTAMAVMMLGWSGITLLVHGPAQLVPAPTAANLHFNAESLGWLHGTIWPTIPFIAIIIASGHSLLAMSGFETLAQVYREIAYPKLQNLKITGTIVCLFAVVSTGVITVLAGMIIPDADRPHYVDNLLSGLTMYLVGPLGLRLAFQAFVVFVGVLILAGAVNTSLIGANGVMNRIAEDGVLVDWFRKPHARFGTTFRIINLIALLQVFTIVLSRGDMYLIGEAYAFGVVWSFFLKSLAVLVIRFHRHDQEYKFPFNLKVGKIELPIGLGATTLALLMVAIANLFSKRIATIYGVSFTIAFFIVFTISQRINARKNRSLHESSLEKFNLDVKTSITAQEIGARKGCVVVAVRDGNRLHHLRNILQRTNLRRHDIVVMTVRSVTAGAAEYDLAESQLFSDYEQELFTHVVSLAEKEGKKVDLLVVPAVDPFDAMVQTAARLTASKLVTGVSERMAQDELAHRIGRAWERLPDPRPPLSLEIIAPGRPSMYVNLGPHPPRLWPEDVDRVHQLWLSLTDRVGSKLHHRDIVSIALGHLERELAAGDLDSIVADVDATLKAHVEHATEIEPEEE
ncbi:MAG: APC family permease [Acidobacteria bacterium]|nr:APC family permease [Acidobacteriota bacterium]